MLIAFRNHTHYSLLEALPKVDDLVRHAKELGLPAVAICDKNNLYGAIEFQKACMKHGVKPIFGATLFIESRGRVYELPVFVRNLAGYRNLLRLISISMTKDSGEQCIVDADLKNHSSGLIVFSGGVNGELFELFRQSKSLFEARVSWLQAILDPESLFIEVQELEYDQELDHAQDQFLVEVARLGLSEVASRPCYYLNQNDKSAHRILYLVEGSVERSSSYTARHSTKIEHFPTMDNISAKLKGRTRAIENTEVIANLIDFQIELGAWVFPNIEFATGYNEDLRNLAYEGLKKRGLPESTEVKERLDYELKVIADKGYSPYFLVVYDLLRYARENKILTNIRGSVAGSLVTYLLQITKCNPFEYKLPFERFLNPERPSAPDIDMDYADTRRDEVINYARKKYGVDNVAQIGTFGTMMARGAIKDVARAMKFPYVVGDRISKLVPMPKQGFPVTIEKALEEVSELKDMYDSDREAQTIIDMAQRIEGCARHVSVHAAGTVISPSELWNYTPIQKDPKGGKIITQYDMYSIEDAGLLKFDFLGIRNLTILGDALKLAEETYSKTIDIEEIALDDPVTFSMLARGETAGLFQLNGSGMTRFLKELRPTTIHDINAMVALYRPGPLEMIPEYIRRKHDPSLVSYLDKRLEPILDQSFGVIVYQDDVMLIAINLAGYSWLEADKLRKAMGKKIPAEMQAQKEKLLKGFKEYGLSEKKSQELWGQIEPFAAYGFNKAHAASYGRVAYQTAYMKANFPYAYMTAVLSNESGDVDKVSEIVEECKRMRIKVLPPHVNKSLGNFSIVKEGNSESIQFGLFTIKGLGEDVASAIVEERETNGEYNSLEDLINRLDHKNFTRKTLEVLAKCGALDGFAKREDILASLDSLLDHHKGLLKTKSTGQSSLFEFTLSAPVFSLAKGEPISLHQKLLWEKELLGLYVSGSPLDPWKETILARGVDIAYILHTAKDNQSVSIAAIVHNCRITRTKKGDQMALLTLQDYSGSIEIAVFPETYRRYKGLCANNTVIIVQGKVATRNGDKTMVTDEIRALEIK